MMQFMFLRGLLLTVLALIAARALAADTEVTVLLFNEQDSQNESPYISRVLLNKDFMRMDYGEDHDDFVLLDRKTGSIYSVSNEDQRTLVIPSQEVRVDFPRPLRHDIEKLDAGGVPDVDNKKVSRYYLFTNGKRCMEVYAVPGYQADAVKALSSFAKTLAGQHAKLLALMPDHISDDCDLANNIFEPDRYLSKGFPVRQKSYTGSTRSLVNVKEKMEIDSAIFDLPEGYEKFMPGAFPK